MSWDARICPDKHIGNAKRCFCGKPTVPWSGENWIPEDIDTDYEAAKADVGYEAKPPA